MSEIPPNIPEPELTTAPVPEPAPTPQPEPSPEPGPDPGSAPSPAPAARDWRNARIDQLTARFRQEQAEAARLRAELEALRGPGASSAPAPGPAPVPAPVDVESLANERAQQIASQREFDRQCNEVATQGREQFADFDTRIGGLRALVNPQDAQEVANYNTFLQLAIETGQASTLLYSLGSDPNSAQRILSLSPVKMAMELTKLAQASASDAVRSPSSAPRPITPVTGGRQAAHTAIDPGDPDRSDRLTTAEWMARREEQLRRQQDGRR